MIYTLIFTAVFWAHPANRTAVHSEHDYPTVQACQAAYNIAKKQLDDLGSITVQGTCLKVK